VVELSQRHPSGRWPSQLLVLNYVLRGVEKRALRILTKRKILGVVGLSGVGKTALLYYLAAVLILRGKKAIVIEPCPGLEEPMPKPVLVIIRGKGEREQRVLVPVLEVPNYVERLPDGREPLGPTIAAVVDILATKWNKIEKIMEKNKRYKTADGIMNGIKEVLEVEEEVTDLLSRDSLFKSRVNEMLGRLSVAVEMAAGALGSAVSLATIALAAARGIIAWWRKRKISKVAKELGDVFLLIDDPTGFVGEGTVLLLKALGNTFREAEFGGVGFAIRADVKYGREFVEFLENPVAHVAERIRLGLTGLPLSPWSEENVALLSAPDLEVFKAIMRANTHRLPEEARDRVEDESFLEELYKATGGLPAIALSLLMLSIEPDKVMPTKAEYCPFSYIEQALASLKPKLARKMAEAALKSLYWAAISIYNELADRDVGYTALLAQPLGLSPEELSRFYRLAECLPARLAREKPSVC